MKIANQNIDYVREQADIYITQSLRKARIACVAVAALKQFDGKISSRLMRDAVQKALPKCTIQYSDNAGMTVMSIWDGRILPYESRVSLRIGYGRSKYNHKSMLESDTVERYAELGREADVLAERISELALWAPVFVPFINRSELNRFVENNS